jgi:hypothetical protein
MTTPFLLGIGSVLCFLGALIATIGGTIEENAGAFVLALMLGALSLGMAFHAGTL